MRVNGLWGFVTPSGGYAIEPRYSDARSFSNGRAAVETGSGWAYVDASGQVVFTPTITVQQVGDFADDRTPYATGEGWGFFDASGAPVIPSRYVDAGGFSNGLARVQLGSGNTTRVGFIDPSGETIIEPTFREVRDFSEGLAAVRIDRKWTFVGTRGRLLATEEFDAVDDFYGGLARVQFGTGSNPRVGYVDRSGALVWYPTN